MNRLLPIVLLYLAMFLSWTGAGLFMLLAPGRFGNLVHDNLNLFPEVNQGDWGRKLVVRVLGIGLLAFAARFAIRAAQLSN
jgi:hypothetical protein